MRIRDFAVLGILTMVVFQIITAAASINLLERMSPAIERILSGNVASITAAEDMLFTLSDPTPLDRRRAQFKDALFRARKNTVNAHDLRLLGNVSADAESALTDDRAAKARVSGVLRELTVANRASMRRADEEAKRIGNRGAWAMALLGIVSFFMGVLVLRKIVRGVIGPVEEIRNVLEAHLRGETARRVFLRNVAPDLSELGALVNQTLARICGDRPPDSREKDVLRAGLLHFMDAAPQPLLLASPSSETIAANSAMETLMRTDQRKEVERLLENIGKENAPVVSEWHITPLKDIAFLVQQEPAH